MQTTRPSAALLGLLAILAVSGAAGAAAEKAPAPAPAPTPAPVSQPALAAQPAPLPDPVVVVNGAPVSRALYNVYAQQRQARMGDADSAEAQQALIDYLVQQELLVQQAQQQHLTDDPQVVQQMEVMKRNVLSNAVLRKMLSEKVPSEADIKKEYETTFAPLGNKEYKVRHILVDSEDQAKGLIEQLKKGGDFGALAKANSSDDSAAEGGELDWFSPDAMDPFGQAVSKLEKGKFTGQPVKTDLGWHIIMLDDVRNATPPPLEEVRPQIVQALQNQSIKEYLEKLRKDAKVEIK